MNFPQIVDMCRLQTFVRSRPLSNEMIFGNVFFFVPYGYDDEYWAQRALSIPLWHHIALHMAVFCFWYISNLFLNLTVRLYICTSSSLLVEHFALTFLLLNEKLENCVFNGTDCMIPMEIFILDRISQSVNQRNVNPKYFRRKFFLLN